MFVFRGRSWNWLDDDSKILPTACVPGLIVRYTREEPSCTDAMPATQPRNHVVTSAAHPASRLHPRWTLPWFLSVAWAHLRIHGPAVLRDERVEEGWEGTPATHTHTHTYVYIEDNYIFIFPVSAPQRRSRFVNKLQILLLH